MRRQVSPLMLVLIVAGAMALLLLSRQWGAPPTQLVEPPFARQISVGCDQPPIMDVQRTHFGLLEREKITCPNATAPHDGLGVRKRIPQALLIGVMKGGTGAIKHFLNGSDYVAVYPNEYHYFSDDEKYVKGLEWYESQMPPSEPHQVTVEGSPGYLPTWRSVRRIWATNPCMKIIITLVDPVERIISHFTHMAALDLPMLYKFGHPRDYQPTFHDFYFQENGQPKGDEATGIGESKYYWHIDRWLLYFPPEQIHIVDGDLLKTEPWTEMVKLEKFLGVPVVSDQAMFRLHTERGVWCHVKKGCMGKAKGRLHVNVTEEDQATLREFYREDNQRLYDLLGHRFSWTY